jgi:hypothetical protein
MERCKASTKFMQEGKGLSYVVHEESIDTEDSKVKYSSSKCPSQKANCKIPTTMYSDSRKFGIAHISSFSESVDRVCADVRDLIDVIAHLLMMRRRSLPILLR